MADKNKSTIELIQCDMFKDLWVVLYLFEQKNNGEIIRALLQKVTNMAKQRQLLLLPCIVYKDSNADMCFITIRISTYRDSSMTSANIVTRHT